MVATVTARCGRCDWAVAGREAVLLELRIDGAYSQHVALVRGRTRADYRVLLGSMPTGHHEVTLSHDATRSSADAGIATVDSLTFSLVGPGSADFDVVSHAPFLRARPGTVERFSDFPLVMYAERHAGSEGPAPYDLQYTVIFTNEDGGTPTDRLMATWGRTTDIEFVYGVTAPSGERGPREIIQVEGHRWVDFSGPTISGHPELWVATDNNMVADHGRDDLIRFAPAPLLTSLTDVSREQVMDDQPWTYQVSSAEMLREQRVTAGQPDGTGRMAEPRRYAVVEACGDVSQATLTMDIGVRSADGRLSWHASDLGRGVFLIARGGCFRGGAPLPAGASLADVEAVRVRAFRRSSPNTQANSLVVLTRLNQVFMLDATFAPAHRRVNWTGSLSVPLDGDGVTIPVAPER